MAKETYYANTQAHCTNRACLNHSPTTRLTRAAHAHPLHPQQWFLCHTRLCEYEFEFAGLSGTLNSSFQVYTSNFEYGNSAHLDARIYHEVSSWGFKAKARIPVKQRNHFSYSQLIAAKTHPDGTPMA